MKFKIQAGAELDLLTKSELGEALADWAAEIARGVRFRSISARATVAGGVWTIGGANPDNRSDTLGPAPGMIWAVNRLAVSGNGYATAGTTVTNNQISNVFAAGAAGSLALPVLGQAITGFSVNFQAPVGAVNYDIAITNVAGGGIDYRGTLPAGVGNDLVVNFPNPLPASSAAVAPTVTVPVIAGGPAYSITVFGQVTTGTAADTYAVYVDEVAPSKLIQAGITRGAVWDTPLVVLAGGQRLVLAGIGTGTGGTDVTVSGQVVELPIQLAWQLL